MDHAFHLEAFQAAANNNYAALGPLIDRVDYQPNWQNPDCQQQTALAAACRGGHATCVDMLIKKRADVNQPRADGMTPLMLAAQEAMPACMQILLDAGADRTRKSADRKTALTFAVEYARDHHYPHHARLVSLWVRAIQNLRLLVATSPLGQQLLDFLAQGDFEHCTGQILCERIHDVETLVDVLSDARIDCVWYREKLGLSMGDVAVLLRQSRELLSLAPGGSGSKRAREEFERHAAVSELERGPMQCS